MGNSARNQNQSLQRQLFELLQSELPRPQIGLRTCASGGPHENATLAEISGRGKTVTPTWGIKTYSTRTVGGARCAT